MRKNLTTILLTLTLLAGALAPLAQAQMQPPGEGMMMKTNLAIIAGIVSDLDKMCATKAGSETEKEMVAIINETGAVMQQIHTNYCGTMEPQHRKQLQVLRLRLNKLMGQK